LGESIMKTKWMRRGMPLAAVGIMFGCGMVQQSPRSDGIVRSHVDSYQSGTGHEFDLVRGATTGDRYKAGFGYGDPEKSDWTSTIHWELKGHRRNRDVYEFEWAFSLLGGDTVVSTKDVEYGGTAGVIVFQNEWQTISIEPGSIPLSKNSQPSVPDDA
jgi:hypothetical protein